MSGERYLDLGQRLVIERCVVGTGHFGDGRDVEFGLVVGVLDCVRARCYIIPLKQIQALYMHTSGASAGLRKLVSCE